VLRLSLSFSQLRDYKVVGGECMMDTVIDRKKDNRSAVAPTSLDEYRDKIRKLMYDEIRKVLDEELQRVSQELQEEQRKAIKFILEEHKAAIRQVVEEEKKSIWEKAEMLRQSILKMGL
jgi:dsDNA-binding SOS-regulon protein